MEKKNNVIIKNMKWKCLAAVLSVIICVVLTASACFVGASESKPEVEVKCSAVEASDGETFTVSYYVKSGDAEYVSLDLRTFIGCELIKIEFAEGIDVRCTERFDFKEAVTVRCSKDTGDELVHFMDVLLKAGGDAVDNKIYLLAGTTFYKGDVGEMKETKSFLNRIELTLKAADQSDVESADVQKAPSDGAGAKWTTVIGDWRVVAAMIASGMIIAAVTTVTAVNKKQGQAGE